jgi:hypothetical protein
MSRDSRKSEFISRVTIRGEVKIYLWDEHGNLKDFRHIHNIVPTVGLNHIADQLSSSPGESAMSHMAVGTGTQALVAGITALNSELDRNTLTSRTDSAAVVTYVGTWAAGDGTGAWTEAGIFNAASEGTILCYVTYDVINKGANDSVVITWTLTFADDGV